MPRSIQIELTGHGQDRSFYGLFFDLSPALGALYLHTSAFPSLYMHLQRVPSLSCFRSYYPLLLQRPVRFVNVQSDPYLGYILERVKRFELSRGMSIPLQIGNLAPSTTRRHSHFKSAFTTK